MAELQDGIYYKEGQRPGSSYCVLFLDIQGNMDAGAIGKELSELWESYDDIKNVIAKGDVYKDNSGGQIDLSILIGYRSRAFSIPGTQKQKPQDFDEKYNFCEVNRGNAIVTNTSLLYSDGLSENAVASSRIMVQFISNNESTTKFAWTKTSEFLKNYLHDNGNEGMYIRKFYTGYNRPDSRSWLGFYDGISNLSSSERESIISIKENNLQTTDLWTLNGTYMAFIRMAIDVERWNKTEERIQERIVGRDKATGCPIIEVNDDKNVLLPGCPTYGTDSVIQYGNQIYRSISDKYGNHKDGELRQLESSHMNRMVNAFTKLDSKGEESKIFRQGYDYLEPSDKYPYYSVGLNFVSFQNNPEKLYNLLLYGFSKNYDNEVNKPDLELSDFVRVESAGLFFVPAFSNEDKFPGSILFQRRSY
jgi:deferrochelatase/peroxidase EfeB